jgi:hypothetical protein
MIYDLEAWKVGAIEAGLEEAPASPISFVTRCPTPKVSQMRVFF